MPVRGQSHWATIFNNISLDKRQTISYTVSLHVLAMATRSTARRLSPLESRALSQPSPRNEAKTDFQRGINRVGRKLSPFWQRFDRLTITCLFPNWRGGRLPAATCAGSAPGSSFCRLRTVRSQKSGARSQNPEAGGRKLHNRGKRGRGGKGKRRAANRRGWAIGEPGTRRRNETGDVKRNKAGIYLRTKEKGAAATLSITSPLLICA